MIFTKHSNNITIKYLSFNSIGIHKNYRKLCPKIENNIKFSEASLNYYKILPWQKICFSTVGNYTELVPVEEIHSGLNQPKHQ